MLKKLTMRNGSLGQRRKRPVGVLLTALTSPNPGSFRGAHKLLPNAGRVPSGWRTGRAGSCQRLGPAPGRGHAPSLPPSPLTAVSGGHPSPSLPASAALPFARLPLPPNSHSRGGSQGQPRAASTKLPTLTISSRLALELQGACSPSPPHKWPRVWRERGSRAGVRTELTYSNPTGDTVPSLSPRHLGRTSPRQLRLSLLPPRRRHIRVRESLGNPGGFRTLEVQHHPGLNCLVHTHTPRFTPTPYKPGRPPLPKIASVKDRRPQGSLGAPRLYSSCSAFRSANSPGLALASQASFPEPQCAVHAGACSCLSSHIILSFLGKNCSVYWALGHGEFLS